MLVSYNDGLTFTTADTFATAICGLYVHNGPSQEYLFVSTAGGKLYQSTIGGEFSEVLQMTAEKYAYTAWSFASSDSKIIVGEYGGRDYPAAAYLSTDDGSSWSVLFNTSTYSASIGMHIHLVAFDPYDSDTYYINCGDDYRVFGLYVTTDGGSTWAKKACTDNILDSLEEVSNGFLSCVFPDEDRVLFFTDAHPMIYEYVKTTGELRLLAQLPDPYTAADVKFYSAVMGADGVIYIAGTRYGTETNISNIWLTIDGSSFYRIDHNPNDNSQFPLRAHDGSIYSNSMKFNDLTKEQAAQLISNDRRSVDMLFDSTRYIDFTRAPLRNVTINVTGANVTNLLTNPSFESGTTSWTNVPGSPIATASVVTTKARDGAKSVFLNQTNAWYGQYSQDINKVASGKPLCIFASVTSDTSQIRDFRFVLVYNAGAGNVEKYFKFSAASNTGYDTDGIWTDAIWLFTPPAGSTLKSFRAELANATSGYIDRLGVSEYQTWVSSETPSGDVSFTLGGRTIDAGTLAAGQSYTENLGSDVCLDGMEAIVPISGIAYNVNVTGSAPAFKENPGDVTIKGAFTYTPNAYFAHSSVSIDTNASWISLSGSTISGNPTTLDIGSYWLNVTLENEYFSIYQNSSLTVDPSIFYITSIPVTNWTAGNMYYYNVTVVSNGAVTYWVNPESGLTISNASGMVSGDLSKGVYDVQIRVYDTYGNTEYQNYTLWVNPSTVQDEWSIDNVFTWVFLIVLLLTLTFVGLRYAVVMMIAGMAYVIVSTLIISPINYEVSLLSLAFGLFFCFMGVYRFAR